jgi:hypothetical protein
MKLFKELDGNKVFFFMRNGVQMGSFTEHDIKKELKDHREAYEVLSNTRGDTEKFFVSNNFDILVTTTYSTSGDKAILLKGEEKRRITDDLTVMCVIDQKFVDNYITPKVYIITFED